MKEEIISYVLGNLTFPFLVAFYLFALVGVIFSMLVHFKRSKTKSIFSIKYWIQDNIVRFFTSFFAIFIVARFLNDIIPGIELGMFAALVVGISLDQVIILIRNKTDINLFQKK